MRSFLSFLGAALIAVAVSASPSSAQPASSAVMPSCSASDPVVWVNTKSNVFHVRGDKYFGTTKHGKYLCQSAAVAAGARAAKHSMIGRKKDANGTRNADAGAMSGTPDAEASPQARKHHRKHHRNSMMGAPSPAASPRTP